jgi:hypothetical protein
LAGKTPVEKLQLNRKLKQNWLNWEPALGGPPRLQHIPGEVDLGIHGGYHLFTASWEDYNQFLMFILEATAQSSAIGGGGGGAKTNSGVNGPLIVVPTGGGG